MSEVEAFKYFRDAPQDFLFKFTQSPIDFTSKSTLSKQAVKSALRLGTNFKHPFS